MQINFSSISTFKSHLASNQTCKQKLPYCCDYCGFIGYNIFSWEKHLQFNPSCDHFYKEKDVTTGLLPDLSVGKLPHNPNYPNQKSFSYQRFSSDGTKDYVNLNIELDSQSKISQTQRLQNFINKHNTSSEMENSYLNTARLMTSITEETTEYRLNDLEDFDSVTDNGIEEHENTEIDDGQLAGVNFVGESIHELTNDMNQMDLRDDQSILKKRYKALTLTKNDIICLDLYHMLKAKNAPIIMYI